MPELLATREIAGRPASAELSTEVQDDAWDTFLSETPLGQFQQSGMWARTKSEEGWNPTRVVLKVDGRIVGGFQILSGRTRLGPVGYISKGPVALEDVPEWGDYLVRLAQEVAAKRKLLAMIVQPPDRARIVPGCLDRSRFLANHLVEVIESTLIVNLQGSFEEVEQRMARDTRRKVRQSLRRGSVVREGDSGDLPLFFKLMAATCERQGVKPNPPNEAALVQLWESFHRRGCVRLTLACVEGEAVSGQLTLLFGKMIIIWKKGWGGQHGNRHPNDLLTHESFEWACAKGYHFADFAGLKKPIAKAILEGRELSMEQRNGRDAFNLSFGGGPVLLPEARVWLPRPLFRQAYRLAFSLPGVKALSRRFSK